IGLAIVAAFVWLLAAALVYAAGPLAVLGQLMTPIQGILDRLFATLQTAIRGLRELLGMTPHLSALGTPPPPPPPSPAPTALPATAAGGGGTGGAAAAAPTPTALASAPSLASVPGLPALGSLPSLQSLASASPGGGAGNVNRSVNVQGGINVAVNADKLEANAGQMLSEEIIRGIRQRLGSLQAGESFRTGERAEAPS